jgi:hypothetical protein
MKILKEYFLHGKSDLPPPSTLRQIQSLEGKANILRRFIPNYVELTKGFTRFLNKGYNFV